MTEQELEQYALDRLGFRDLPIWCGRFWWAAEHTERQLRELLAINWREVKRADLEKLHKTIADLIKQFEEADKAGKEWRAALEAARNNASAPRPHDPAGGLAAPLTGR